MKLEKKGIIIGAIWGVLSFIIAIILFGIEGGGIAVKIKILQILALPRVIIWWINSWYCSNPSNILTEPISGGTLSLCRVPIQGFMNYVVAVFIGALIGYLLVKIYLRLKKIIL